VCLIAENEIAKTRAETKIIETKDRRNEYHRHKIAETKIAEFPSIIFIDDHLPRSLFRYIYINTYTERDRHFVESDIRETIDRRKLHRRSYRLSNRSLPNFGDLHFDNVTFGDEDSYPYTAPTRMLHDKMSIPIKRKFSAVYTILLLRD
jgi:hypothetical protein